MYGGLFGDLPAAKNDTASSKEKKDDNDGTEKETKAHQAEEKNATKLIAKDADGSSKNISGPEAVGNPVKNASVLQSLGVAGTSMAFVPSHLKRKRNATSNKTAAPPVFIKPTAQPNNSTNNDTVKVPAVAMDLATWQEETQLKTVGQQDAAVHDPHATQTQKSASAGGASFSNHPSSGNSPKVVVVESEDLRLLHDSVTEDMAYDPLVPNDLLQYWERQAAVLERKELEREAKEAMEVQARMRKQLEVERQELERSGDVNKLAEHHARIISSGGGRGRGRGVSNLPKWLVDKQKEEARLRNLPEGKE